jgi:hypothetical protein
VRRTGAWGRVMQAVDAQGGGLRTRTRKGAGRNPQLISARAHRPPGFPRNPGFPRKAARDRAPGHHCPHRHHQSPDRPGPAQARVLPTLARPGQPDGDPATARKSEGNVTFMASRPGVRWDRRPQAAAARLRRAMVRDQRWPARSAPRWPGVPGTEAPPANRKLFLRGHINGGLRETPLLASIIAGQRLEGREFCITLVECCGGVRRRCRWSPGG